MWTLLAKLERDEALTQGYSAIASIVTITLIGIALLLALFVIRRWTRRQLDEIEQDREARRQKRSAERVDAWQAGAERYVDHDKLPAEAPGSDDPTPPAEGEEPPDEDQDPTPPGWEEPTPEDEADPYGLFDDKPYRDSEDDEDDEDWEEDDWDEDGPGRP